MNKLLAIGLLVGGLCLPVGAIQVMYYDNCAIAIGGFGCASPLAPCAGEVGPDWGYPWWPFATPINGFCVTDYTWFGEGRERLRLLVVKPGVRRGIVRQAQD